MTPTYQVPRSICLPIFTSAEEDEEKERRSVNERPIVTKHVKEEEGKEEEEVEEGGTQWESFSPCQETLVPGERTSSDYSHTQDSGLLTWWAILITSVIKIALNSTIKLKHPESTGGLLGNPDD